MASSGEIWGWIVTKESELEIKRAEIRRLQILLENQDMAYQAAKSKLNQFQDELSHYKTQKTNSDLKKSVSVLSTRFTDLLEDSVFGKQESINQTENDFENSICNEIVKTGQLLDTAQTEEQALVNTISNLYDQHGAAVRHEEWEREQSRIAQMAGGK